MTATPRLRDSATPQKKATILILTDWFHPGYKAGGPIRSIVNLVNLLAGEYEIYILTSDRDHGDNTKYTGLLIDEWIDYKNIAKVKYLSVENQSYINIKKILQEIKPDFLYLNSMFSKIFSIYPVLAFQALTPKTRVILAPRGMLQAGALQFKSLKKKLFIFLLKLSGKLRNIYFHATDIQEKVDIIENLKIKENHIFEIGNIPGADSVVKSIPKTIKELKLIFISRIAAKKNLNYIFEILSNISSKYKITLTICGGIEDEKHWDKCKESIDNLMSNIKVDYKGAIIFEETHLLLQTHHAFILPTLGENFGHAIFEALIAARPVIISDQTPWRDLTEKKAGWDISLNEPEKFRNAVETLAAMNQKEYDEWSKGARAVADKYIASSNLKEKYLKLFS